MIKRVRKDRLGKPGALPSNGWVMLVLGIIKEAAEDAVNPKSQGYESAMAFFQSEYYLWLLDFVAAHLPDFEPAPGLLPVGVQLPAEGG